MRGSPLLLLLVLAVVLSLLGVPIWSLTHQMRRTNPSLPKIQSIAQPQWVDVILTSSAPGVFFVKSLDRTLLQTSSAVKSFESRIPLTLESPEDLVVSGKWEGSSSPHALRIEIKFGGESLVDMTFWGTETLQEVVTIPERH